MARQAVPLPDFLFEALQQRADVSRLDGRARMVELARPLLSKIPDGLFRQMMFDRLAELSELDPQKLSRLGLRTEESAPTRPVKSHGAELKKPPSLVRGAVALLLRHPPLAQRVADPGAFAGLDLPGVSLLRALLDILQTDPGLNTAAIIERFRTSQHRPHLEKLAVWTHPMLEQDIEAEFEGILVQLHRAAREQRTDRLLQKEQAKGLNRAEKAELGRLLVERETSDGLAPEH